MKDVTIVTSWDSLPPEVHYGGEVFSTRVLCKQHQDALAKLAKIRAALAQCKRSIAEDGNILGAADRQLRIDIEGIMETEF